MYLEVAKKIINEMPNSKINKNSFFYTLIGFYWIEYLKTHKNEDFYTYCENKINNLCQSTKELQMIG